MLIQFSHPLDAAAMVHAVAARHNANPDIKWSKVDSARFTLNADDATHELVIADLLAYDPQAMVRTARAIYHGLADYKRQHP